MSSFFLLMLFVTSPIHAAGYSMQDTCTVNDACEGAIPIQNLVTNSSDICISGCTTLALPETISSVCFMDSLPTVWYKVTMDDRARKLRIRIASSDISSPRLSVFKFEGDCASMQQVVPNANEDCKKGFVGRLEIVGIEVDPLATYLIAVTADDFEAGNFTLCANTYTNELPCYARGRIDVTDRSIGVNDEPFLPGELVGVCMKVEEFRISGATECTWFQGLVPHFGSAWDPSSFDASGQPLQSTINGLPSGDSLNGLYSTSTWDWFADVGYHHTNSILQIGDQDGNNTPDLCTTLFEDCQDFGGVTGGCCGPCWLENGGQILPPGWFAYGINGTCATKGHPNVDWGDGNTCAGISGPWNFCFDLKVKNFPDCLQHDPEKDLRLSFYTKADAETGSTIGKPSICIEDKPEIRFLSMSCGTNVQQLDPVQLPSICSGDTFSYALSEPGVIHWYWNVEPRGFNYPPEANSPNPLELNSVFYNPTSEPVLITYYLRGSLDSTGSYVSKNISFLVDPSIRVEASELLTICHNYPDVFTYTIKAEGGNGELSYLWTPGGNTTPTLTLTQPFEDENYHVAVTDEAGCVVSKDIQVSIDSTCIIYDDHNENDESNDGPVKQDPILPGNFTEQNIEVRTSFQEMKIFPVPGHDQIVVQLINKLEPEEKLIISDYAGRVFFQINGNECSGQRIPIDVSVWNNGLYQVVLHKKQSIWVGKLVKI